MAYSSACFSTANVIETDMQQVEDNFDALRDHFANSTAPTSPQSGQFWSAARMPTRTRQD